MITKPSETIQPVWYGPQVVRWRSLGPAISAEVKIVLSSDCPPDRKTAQAQYQDRSPAEFLSGSRGDHEVLERGVWLPIQEPPPPSLPSASSMQIDISYCQQISDGTRPGHSPLPSSGGDRSKA